eukprot:11833488-Alexandrium_andersonii.AAC.1
MDTREPLPRAEAVPAVDADMAEPVPGSPPRAGEPPMAQAELKLPFSQFPGLVDVGDPVMQACYEAWSEVVQMVGAEFVSSVAG